MPWASESLVNARLYITTGYSDRVLRGGIEPLPHVLNLAGRLRADPKQLVQGRAGTESIRRVEQVALSEHFISPVHRRGRATGRQARQQWLKRA